MKVLAYPLLNGLFNILLSVTSTKDSTKVLINLNFNQLMI